ncbi:hypothetical protein ACOMHN_023453 [Nucella lapillus]
MTMEAGRYAAEALVVLLMACVVSPFPSGAPLSACGHLMPIHEEAEAQRSAAPFIILLSSTNYTSGEPIAVTVTSSEPYLAFMLQGRTLDNQPVGHFSRPPPVAKFLNCYGQKDTLSHAAAFEREGMQVLWHPPKEDVGDVFIIGSIARTKYIFWAVESERIKGIPKPGGSGADRYTSNVLVMALSLVTVLAFRLVHTRPL